MKPISYKNTSFNMMIHGIIAILIGFAFLFATKELISTIVIVFGLIILIAGALVIMLSFSSKNKSNNSNKYLGLLQGILFLSLGLFISLNSEAMVKFIILFFGIWAIIAGGFQLLYGFQSKDYFKSNNLLIINGLILLLMGILMAFKHDFFLNFIGTIIGIISLIIGFISLYFSFKFNKNKAFKEAEIIDE